MVNSAWFFDCPAFSGFTMCSRDGRVLLSKESWRSGLQFRGPTDKKERDLSWLDYATLRDISSDGTLISFDDWGSAAGAQA